MLNSEATCRMEDKKPLSQVFKSETRPKMELDLNTTPVLASCSSHRLNKRKGTEPNRKLPAELQLKMEVLKMELDLNTTPVLASCSSHRKGTEPNKNLPLQLKMEVLKMELDLNTTPVLARKRSAIEVENNILKKFKILGPDEPELQLQLKTVVPAELPEEVLLKTVVAAKLPEEVLLKILDDHLPVEAQCRLRAVCRAWNAPLLRRGNLSVVPSYVELERHLFLYDHGGECERLQPLGVSLRYEDDIADCIDGLFVLIRGFKCPVSFSVFNMFCPGVQSRWAHLPAPPAAPQHSCIFAALSKMNEEPPRISSAINLDAYLLLVVMGITGFSTPVRKMVVQVYKAGRWSSRWLELPAGHHLMLTAVIPLRVKCGVLRGSIFYFLAYRSGFNTASLYCVDVGGPGEKLQCNLICPLDKSVMVDEKAGFHPKLALCSAGKLLLVYNHALDGEGECTAGIQQLNEETMRWRLVSCLPKHLRPDPVTLHHRSDPSFSLIEMHFGGDQIVAYNENGGEGYIYNAATDSWKITRRYLCPIR